MPRSRSSPSWPNCARSLTAPADKDVLATLAEAGVERVLLELPRTDRDTTLRALDGHADLLT